MPDSQNETGEELSPNQQTMVRDKHKLFLQALRHREQQIVQFLAILVPALGAFLWLLRPVACVQCKEGSVPVSPELIATGAIAAIFLLCVGAVYAVALGFNFRSFVMQTAKIEAKTSIQDYVLIGWPGKPSDFKTCYCTPPEMIMVFWLSFLAGIVGVALAAWYHVGNKPVFLLVALTAILALGVGGLAPLRYGCKLTKMADKEDPKHWQPPRDNQAK